MNILVINTGSSSIKYQLFNMPNQQPLCSGLVERIGLSEGVIAHNIFRQEKVNTTKEQLEIKDHEAGLLRVAALLTDPVNGVIKDPSDIFAVGHRVVHGGEAFAATTIINDAVKEKIQELFPLAPLHNPANYTGITVAEKIFSSAIQVAVFDTAFHQTMPEHAFRYAIPASLYTENRIRAYGFHGTSHKFVSEQAAAYLGNEKAKIITVHLGNGCSMAAVDSGRSIDTTMGFGPVSGLVMGTRSGDIDASVIFHLAEQNGMTIGDISNVLNKKSGMLGLAGYSDMREIGNAYASGDANAMLAVDIYTYRIRKYIGAYAAAMNGLDAVVFTAGVGENSALIREKVCNNMQYLGLKLDSAKNAERAPGIREINEDDATVKILVVPTNEELEIVRQCYALLNQ